MRSGLFGSGELNLSYSLAGQGQRLKTCELCQQELILPVFLPSVHQRRVQDRICVTDSLIVLASNALRRCKIACFALGIRFWSRCLSALTLFEPGRGSIFFDANFRWRSCDRA